MIILDTNIVSELLKPQGDSQVLGWMASQKPGTLFLTTTSLAELLFGVEILPDGKRKRMLDAALDKFVTSIFAILPFDKEAAKSYALLVGQAGKKGSTIHIADGQIAAIAAVHKYVVATRDTPPFAAAGVHVVNPWRG